MPRSTPSQPLRALEVAQLSAQLVGRDADSDIAARQPAQVGPSSQVVNENRHTPIV